MDGFNQWFNETCEKIEQEKKETEIKNSVRMVANAIKEFENQGFTRQEAIDILKNMTK